MLGAGHERRVLQRFPSQRGEQILDHFAVDRDVLRFGRLPKPGGEEQISRGNTGKGSDQGAAIA
jgi:hypothetical protein